MKKTGKALSLVLSLALVASSLTATFASAATTADDPTVGVSVSFDTTGSDYSAYDGTQTLALVAGETGGTALKLPKPVLKYTTASGKVYTSGALTEGTDYSWSSSDSSVVGESSGTILPGTKTTAGSATLTCSINSKTIDYGDSTTDNVTISGSKSISVKTYAPNDFAIVDHATAYTAGAEELYVPSATTELAVNDSKQYDLVKVTPGTNAAEPKLTAESSVTWHSSSNDYIAIGTDGTVAAQYTDKVHITGVTITATDTATASANVTPSLAIHTAQIYDTDATNATTAITASNAYGSGNAQAGGLKSTTTGGNHDAGMYNVSNYAIKGSSIELDGGTVASATATGAATLNGGSVTGLLKGATVTLTTGSAGSVEATTGVNSSTVPAGKTLNVGNIAAGTSGVSISGKGATVGAIRSLGAVSLSGGVTSGAITAVPTATNNVTNNHLFSLAYPTVTINSVTVNGNIVCGSGSTIKGTARDNNVVIPTVVKGNVLAYDNGYPDGTISTGTVQIGSNDPGEKVTINGSVADQTGSMAITLAGVSDGTTGVGAVTGKSPATGKTANTTLTFDGFNGSFSTLPNFDVVTLTNKSVVAVTSALNVNALNLGDSNSVLTVPGASLNAATGSSVAYALNGSGKLVVPAGALVLKGAVSGNPVIAPSSNVAVGTMIFKGISGLANTVSVPGVTLDEKSNGDNTYNYVAKTVTFGGIQLDQAAMKVANGYTGTVNASAVPTGAALPAGDSIKWEVPDGSSVTVTPSANGMSAVVKATSWSDVDLGGANEVTLSAYVVKADGTQDYNYATQTCAVTVIEKPTVIPTTFTCDSFPTTMKAGQQYTVKITSNDGTDPKVTFADGFAVVMNTTKSGNATFVKFTAKTAGDHGVYVGGNRKAIIKVAGSICDTTTVSKKAGQPYTFKVTSLTKAAPTFVVAGIGSIKPSKVNGNAYYYTVKATANKGVHGVYVNGAAIALYTFA